MFEYLEGKKTIIFFVLFALLTLANMFGFTEYKPTTDEAEWIALGISFIGITLRNFTKKPIFYKS